MILHRLTRAKSAWRPLSESARSTRSFHAIPRLQQHEVPDLAYQAAYEVDGIDGVLDAKSYDVAWTQNMSYLINRLNRSTTGSDAQHAQIKQLVLQYARNPSLAAVFNAASLAHNNHFFFETFSPSPGPLEDYKSLSDSLVAAFGSIEALRKTMLTTANAMYAPGYVWLAAVKTRDTIPRLTWKILTTYNTGTPYPEAGVRQQDKDVNNTAGSFGQYSDGEQNRTKGQPGAPSLLTPVLCVSTWEHVYLTQYGVGGKSRYLMAWWNHINWAQVDQRAPAELKVKPRSDRPFV